MLEILERFVLDEGYSYLRMDGGTAIGSRGVLVNRFNKVSITAISIMVIDITAIGITAVGVTAVGVTAVEYCRTGFESNRNVIVSFKILSIAIP